MYVFLVIKPARCLSHYGSDSGQTALAPPWQMPLLWSVINKDCQHPEVRQIKAPSGSRAQAIRVLLAGSSSLPQIPQELLLKLSVSGRKELGQRMSKLRKSPAFTADAGFNGAWFWVKGTMAIRKPLGLKNCPVDSKSKTAWPQHIFRGGRF